MVDIANSLNISKQSIHQWETTQTFPSSDKLIELADILECSLDYLVGRSEDPVLHKESLDPILNNVVNINIDSSYETEIS
jgi:transcriptional regulator with XRE-family HTH domain